MTIFEEEDDILEVQLKGSKKIDDLILLEIYFGDSRPGIQMLISRKERCRKKSQRHG